MKIFLKAMSLSLQNLGENMPAEILIGRIKKISISSNTPYKIIEVEPFADYKRLEYALVIKE